MLANKLAIVTGANKGIGFAIVEKLLAHSDKPKIILAARNPTLGEDARKTLLEKYPSEEERLIYQELDIDSENSISEFSYWLYNNHHEFDVLVNNAAIGDVKDIMGTKGYVMPADQVRLTIRTNFYSTVKLTESLLPFLSSEGKIVNVSSTLAKFAGQGKELKEFFNTQSLTKDQLFDKMKDFEEKAVNNEHTNSGYNKSVYITTKAFLNAYVKWVLLPQMKEKQSCFAVYPGWCKTDMGTQKAPMTAEQGTTSTMHALNLNQEDSLKNNGAFFDEKAKVASY